MEAISETAANGLKVLNFGARHGLAATPDAFNVSRRTRWVRHCPLQSPLKSLRDQVCADWCGLRYHSSGSRQGA